MNFNLFGGQATPYVNSMGGVSTQYVKGTSGTYGTSTLQVTLPDRLGGGNVTYETTKGTPPQSQQVSQQSGGMNIPIPLIIVGVIVVLLVLMRK